jgi:hypothetical protein
VVATAALAAFNIERALIGSIVVSADSCMHITRMGEHGAPSPGLEDKSEEKVTLVKNG